MKPNKNIHSKFIKLYFLCSPEVLVSLHEVGPRQEDILVLRQQLLEVDPVRGLEVLHRLSKFIPEYSLLCVEKFSSVDYLQFAYFYLVRLDRAGHCLEHIKGAEECLPLLLRASVCLGLLNIPTNHLQLESSTTGSGFTDKPHLQDL